MSRLIRNSIQAKQGIDFYGLQNGLMHPSDIDAVLEFDNEAIIFIELKKLNNHIPTGQRLLLERLTDSWHTKKAITLKAIHNFAGDDDIPLHICRVEKFYHKGKWTDFNENLKVFLNKLGKKWKINKLKFDD